MPKKTKLVSTDLLADAGETRRALLKKMTLAGLSVGAVAATGVSMPTAQADSHLSKIEEDSPQAKALGYKHDTADVDPEKYPQSQNGNKACANCRLYSAATADGWGVCPIFAGKLVSGAGWCSAWVAMAPSQ